MLDMVFEIKIFKIYLYQFFIYFIRDLNLKLEKLLAKLDQIDKLACGG
jgi:hypothetical protein